MKGGFTGEVLLMRYNFFINRNGISLLIRLFFTADCLLFIKVECQGSSFQFRMFGIYRIPELQAFGIEGFGNLRVFETRVTLKDTIFETNSAWKLCVFEIGYPVESGILESRIHMEFASVKYGVFVENNNMISIFPFFVTIRDNVATEDAVFE